MGNRFRTPTKHRVRARGCTGMLLTGALLAGSLSVLVPATASADTGTGTPPATSPDAAALAQAQATGQSVPVPADSTDESNTEANPDGTFTTTATTEPTQVEQNGTWVPLDPTLHQNSDGTWAPNAAASSVVFSGGGTSPLATVTSAAGQQMSLSWPSALPTPNVSGATATYPDVYPGVNLAMTATPAGGYTEQLIVTSATAAANPALANIQFNTSTNGLTLSTTAADGLQALDAAGDTVFASPTATMWSTPTAQTAAQSAAQAFTLHPADTSTSPSATPSVDDTAGTDVGVTVIGSSLDLQPPASALTGSGVSYPVVIDPTVVPKYTNNWTWISKTNSSTSYWQGSNDDYTDGSDAKVGFDDWCSDGSGGCAPEAFGVTRSLFSESLDQFAGKHVTKATFTVYEQGSTSSWTGNREIGLYGAGAFDDKTTWSNAPATFAAYVPSELASLPDSNEIGSGNFDVTTLVQNAVNSGYHTQTMVLEAHDETDDTAYRYLLASGNYAPSLSVTYYSTPNVPSNLSITDGTKTDSCNTTSPGSWISASDTNTVTLNATVSTPDTSVASTPITSDFWVRETEPTLAAHWTNQGGQTVNSQTNGTVTHPPTMTVTNGETYEWQAYASEDGGAFSTGPAPSASSACWFSVDTTPPTLNPPVGTPPTTAGGTPGSLQVSATDPGSNASGVTEILYNMNGTSLTAGGDGENSIPATNGATISIPLNADHWGTNTLWWGAEDAAGNIAVYQTPYPFTVSAGTYTIGTAGDLTGDGTPDLATVDSSGNIGAFNNPFAYTPATAPTSPAVMIPAATAASTTGGSTAGPGFTGSLIAHSGSTHQQNCDDLDIIQNGNLLIEQNNNCLPVPSATWTAVNAQRPAAPAAGTPAAAVAAYRTSDWSQTQQLLALSAPVTNTGGGTDLATTDLITIELSGGTDYLWEYPMDGANPKPPNLLASGPAFSAVTLINPGTIAGHPALWTRNITTGAIEQYLNLDTDTTDTLTGTQIAASGYSAATYPQLTAVGDITNSSGASGPALWAVDTTGTLQLIPTTVDSSGNTTILDPEPMTAAAWDTGLSTIS